MKNIFLLLIVITPLLLHSQSKKETKKPNILLLVADDLGYADLGCYGGDIETPNIDKLAQNGIRFSRFHTSPLCAPTRAMLLSGNDNHIAGMGRQGLVTNEFGYEGQLSDRIVTIPQVLKTAGYHTYMAGKWHLGATEKANPKNKGFDRSFITIRGGANHYNDQGIFKETPTSLYTEDGKSVKWKNGNYSTDFYTDKLIEYIGSNKGDGKPFFVFGAFTSPHWPLQVDEKYSKKYKGRYDDGYEKLKKRRLASLKKAGMIPGDAVLPPNHSMIKAWSSLSEKEKKKESKKMELYAGMVDNLDYNIGRIIQYLKNIGEFENTLIVFMSDNGAAAEDFYHDDDYGPFLRKHFNVDYDNMGKPNSFISYGPQWAEAGSSPFKYFKGLTTEGGINTPMIISGKGISKKNSIENTFLTLMDLAPSFYEVAGATYPKKYDNKKVYPLKGNSIIPFVSGKANSIHNKNYVFGLEHGSKAMIRKGEWKITNIERPFSIENFKLYNLANDLAELHDLKDVEKEKYKEMLREWDDFSKEIKVQVSVPSGD